MGERLKRMEVWFLNGTRQDGNVLRAFPHTSSIEEDEERYTIIFGGDHKAVIYKRNILFVEIFDEEG